VISSAETLSPARILAAISGVTATLRTLVSGVERIVDGERKRAIGNQRELVVSLLVERKRLPLI